MNKILVTGGTGYIGSHTVVELQQAGYEVVIVDNLDNSSIGILDQITKISGIRPTFHELDLCEEEKVKDLIANNPDISGVIHFAAHKAVGESVQQPLKYYRNNFFSLINLLTAFAGRKVNFVFSSSCTVYGQPDKLPVTEEAPVKKAESPYGNTKQISEEILSETASVNPNYHIISLRYFNPVGAHESALIGELPIGVPQNLVPFITQSAIGKRGPITVYGSDYNTPDGSCIRDYIHVVDLAKAHIAALRRQEAEKMSGNYEIFNVGTGKGSSVLEVIKAFESSTGVKLNYKIGERREGDVEQVWGDVSKAEQELNWKAGLGLDEMMRSAWAWENYINEHPL
ncbi:UDP-glucose 4-epimerase [Arcticibacter tournemirensis]|uniref:UDP-glucose 4-epimerase n=1 Tax=Arcticibacter tournemirensis TaxID=699437 RepID=A0A4Q0M6X2_9SPHI|nr:UDP-glucose 4-epimerase GalE [Arcticibacter tournemirensis]KAA8482553.1 UDP-glucose 4-epimerase GalE [Arcticibacter tournemirensis]RXF68436.1 UDP-glucose 4-epimerase GalE [Arcticibacter tournemirensis]TQM52520.1 UDP-glucose 4-epimerase [Arcticibacter tournemirensis]